MQFLDQDTPIAIGQVVIHPDLSSKHVIKEVKTENDKTLTKLTTIHGWHNVLFWDRYIPTVEELTTVISYQEDIIDEHSKNARKAEKELIAVQEKLSECELRRGKAEHDYNNKVKDLEVELGNLRGIAIKNQEDAGMVEIKTRQIEEAEGIIASQKRTLERYRNRLSLMMKPYYRVKHQKTNHRFVTLIDDVDTAPQDAAIAGLLDEGWQITSINLKPTWLYDEEVKHRTVSHTKRYITLQRYSVPADDNDTAEEVKLPQSMDEAIKAAIGKNDGSHINQLTMPIELADEALYGEVQS